MIHLGTVGPSCWDSSGNLNDLKKKENLPND